MSANPLSPQRRSSSFFLPMLLLGKNKRHALKALYYFCRVVDDSIDEAPSKQQARDNLAFWRSEIENIYSTKNPPNNEVALKIGLAIWQFKLPRQPFEDLFSGMEFDCADDVQIDTEQELDKYCYCVAGTVGLQAMLIFGVSGNQADNFAIELGKALQLTNILRDTNKDADIKRSYLPSQWGDNPLSSLIIKAEKSFADVSALEAGLPARKILPALLMRDIYFWKFRRLRINKPASPLPFIFYIRLIFRAISYYLSLRRNKTAL